jgi:hypothetical protein
MQRAVGRTLVGNIGKRTFAGEAASHAPPKKLHGTTGRYAGAVYTAASKVRYYLVIWLQSSCLCSLKILPKYS